MWKQTGGSPEQRLQEQDIDGVDGEIMFTYVAGASFFYNGIRKLAAYKATIHAWNGFLAEEYCAAVPERLMGMGMLPRAARVRRVAARRFRTAGKSTREHES